MKQVFSLLVLLFLYAFASGQENKFRYKADVQKVDSNGVYKIDLQPDLIAKSVDQGLYDIRLVDEHGKFVAYSIINKSEERSKSVFIPFPQKGEEEKNDTVTTYIADAGSRNNVSELWIGIKSNAVTRMASLSGSDDLQHWFAIKEGIELNGDESANNTEYEQQLTFPPSKYRYYRMRITNKNRDPLQITGVGIYIAPSQISEVVSVTQILKPEVKQGKKQTSYFINLGDDHQIDALTLHVTSPKYYTRIASIYDVGHNREELLYVDTIKSGTLKPLSFSVKTNRMRIDIANGDDNPLVIERINVFQQEKFAVAYLEKKHQYHLLTGDSTANEVSYDLTFLHSKPMYKFPEIVHSAVYKNPAFTKLVFKVSKDYTQLIWISIIVVLILLSLLTWRMVKELNAKPRE